MAPAGAVGTGQYCVETLEYSAVSGSRQASPVVLIARVVATSLALAHPHLLAHEVGLLLPLRLVGRGVQVPLVVYYLGLASIYVRKMQTKEMSKVMKRINLPGLLKKETHVAKPPGEHLGAEVVGVAEIGEADDVAPGDGVLDHDHRGDRPDLQAVAQEGCLLRVDLDELGLHMLLGQDGHVLVQDLAPEGLLPIEVAHNVLRVLGHVEELLLLGDLGVLAVALLQPSLLLLLVFLHHLWI